MNYRDFLDTFIVATGANFGSAWELPMPAGFSVLVTDDAETTQPSATTERVTMSFFLPTGEVYERADAVTWEVAIAKVRRWINEATRSLPARNELERVSGRRGGE